MKFLPVVLLVAGLVLTLHAQELASGSWQNIFWNEDVTLANGRFVGGDRKIEVSSKRVEVRGALVDGGRFENLGGVTWTITESSLRKTSLWCKLGDNVNATGSAFEDTELKKFGAKVARNWSSHWVFENCAFAQKFTPPEISTRDYSIRAAHCTFHGIKMPEVALVGDAPRELQTENFLFKNCRFVGCEIPESLLVSTVDCVFERCRFGARGHQWDKNSRLMSVTAYIAEGDPVPESYADAHLKVAFQNANLPVSGSMAAYSYTEGHLALGHAPVGDLLAIGNIDNKTPKPAKIAPPPATPATIAVETKLAEGTPILDRDHADGWKYVGKEEMTIRDGTVSTPATKDSAEGVFLFTKKTFANFVLQMEINVDGASTNSGVYVRFPDPGNNSRVAPNAGVEIDIFGGQTGSVICHPTKGSTDKFPSRGASLLVGAWNDLEISAEGQKYIIKLNGQVVNECTGTGPLTGYIGLQAHKGSVGFRNIRIQELAATPTVAAGSQNGPPGNPLNAPSIAGPGALPTKAAPPNPAPPSTQTTAAELVKTYRNSLVFVTGTNGAGSGFLAKYATGNFLFTNAHVAAGVRGAAFKTLDGTEVKAGAASCAVGHDVFLMQATTNGQPFEIMKEVDQNASIGDEVVVLGNAEGAGVINTITGKIVGVGPQLVEVDAPFQPGNSGSPIIHLKSGKVIGLATYAMIRKYDPSTKEPVKQPVIRRFGYRLDSIKSWQPVNRPAFFAQATEMEAIEKLTSDLAAFINDLANGKGVNLGAHNNPAIQSRIDAWHQARAKGLSPRDAAMANQSLISFLKVACQSDVTAARQHITYDYFQRDLADQKKERDEISGIFNDLIQDLRK